MQKLLIATGVLFFGPAEPLLAQLVSFNFTGAPGNQVSSPPSFVAQFVTASNMTRGPGLTPEPHADSINSTSWTTATSIDLNDYYTFSLSHSTAPFSFTALEIQGNRNGNGPKILELRDSLTGFANAGVIRPLANAALTTINFDLSGRPALQNIAPTTNVELRLYAYDAGNNANGEFFLDSVGGVPAISVNPVPEPTTILGVATASLGLAWGVRRKRSGHSDRDEKATVSN